MAYSIAFRGGRYKNLLLFIVIAPFFTSFLIRTISWKVILGNNGPFLTIVRDTLGLVPDNFSILGSPLAVVAGLTYEFLPFMVLPLYVSVEKVDRRLIEAAKDLYAGPWRPRGTRRPARALPVAARHRRRPPVRRTTSTGSRRSARSLSTPAEAAARNGWCRARACPSCSSSTRRATTPITTITD